MLDLLLVAWLVFFCKGFVEGLYGVNLDSFLTPSPWIPWGSLASLYVAFRYYHSSICAGTYLILDFYYFILVSGGGLVNTGRYMQILIELLRGKDNAQHPQRDHLGRHWSINIAHLCIGMIVNEGLDYLLPDWIWSRMLFQVVLTLGVFGHPLLQLTLQKQLMWLWRLDQKVLKWRDYSLELVCSPLRVRSQRRPLSRPVYIWYWAWHQIYQIVTLRVMNQTAIMLLGISFLYPIIYGAGSRPVGFSLYSPILRCLIFYRVWLRDLIKFANPNPPEYKYSKLERDDHIRLLLLYPRFGFRPISCALIAGHHRKVVMYEAISYTWGSGERTEEILVDGCRMMITKSAFEILATYSSQFLPRLLWIDAICIDQDNIAEKEQQVPKMDQIYSDALFTTVFLGRSPLLGTSETQHSGITRFAFDDILPSDNSVRKHFKDAQNVCDMFNEFSVLREPIRRSGGNIYEMYESFSSDSSKTWTALYTLLQHPWFSRVWVVQEVVLPRAVKVRYGDETIDWVTMTDALKMIHGLREFRLWLEWTHEVRLRHAEHSSLYNITRMDNLRRVLWPDSKYSISKIPSLAQVLAQSFYFKAQNPRDQIYGMLSMCKEKKAIKVDYETSVANVYLAAAVELVRARDFDFLSNVAGIGYNKESMSLKSDLPSWVPDWTNSLSHNHASLPSTQQSRSIFDRRRPKTQPPITLVGDKTLLMKVKPVDNIAQVGPSLFDSGVENQCDSVLEEMSHLCTAYDKCMDFLRSSRLARGLYENSGAHSLSHAFHNQMIPGETRELEHWVDQLHTFGPRASHSSPVDQRKIYKTLKAMEHITMQVESHCGGRRLFVGETGCIGMCPVGTKPGDMICVMWGVKSAIVLRKTGEENSNQYHLVGSCHSRGLEIGNPGLTFLEEYEIELV